LIVLVIVLVLVIEMVLLILFHPDTGSEDLDGFKPSRLHRTRIRG